ncbi:MAG: alkaline phosphatase D family protein [Sphingobium sp.]
MITKDWTRRETVTALGLGGVAATLPTDLPAATKNMIFRHGIASGDPDQTSLILWTRVTSEGDREQVEWELALDAEFAKIVKSGKIETSAGRDFTVKVLVDGLQPGQKYHYRFRAGGEASPVGKTRTLPEGALDRLGIALVSCSNYPFGYFNAYDAVAKDPMVDIVLHTGDYIYEYAGTDGWGHETGEKLGRVHEPAHEIVSLSDYRTRHAQYRADPGLQAMTAAHPFIACWDDHESANNPWVLGAQNHQPETEGSWLVRRTAAIRAYYEWMPIREPGVGRNRAEFWRSYRFGDLATLVTLETRHTGRAEQVDYLKYAETIKTQADADRLKNDIIGAPDRAMISAEMEEFLSGELSRSVKANEPWRIIGNATLFARMNVPDLIGADLLPDPATDGIAFETKALAWKAKWGLPIYTDSWDGYGWARERFYSLCRDTGASDLIVLTGDSHSFWANQLADGEKRPMGIELGTAGVTSPGDFLASGFGPELSKKLDQAFVDKVEEVVWTDNFHQGYVRLDLRRDAAQANFIGMSTIMSPNYKPNILRKFAVSRKGDALKLLG